MIVLSNVSLILSARRITEEAIEMCLGSQNLAFCSELNHQAELLAKDANDEVFHRSTPLGSTLGSVVELRREYLHVHQEAPRLAHAMELIRECCRCFTRSSFTRRRVAAPLSPRESNVTKPATQSQQTSLYQSTAPRHATVQSAICLITLCSMDLWIADKCREHAIMMVCHATEKQDSTETKPRTTSFQNCQNLVI